MKAWGVSRTMPVISCDDFQSLAIQTDSCSMSSANILCRSSFFQKIPSEASKYANGNNLLLDVHKAR